MNPGELLKKSGTTLNNLIFLVKTDEGVRDALRVLVLGLAIIVLLFHSGRQFVLAPMEKKLNRLNIQVTEAEVTASALTEATAQAPILEQMQRKKLMLDDQVRLLETELDFRRQHWRIYGTSAGFNRVIFTTGKNAPFRFDKSLTSMSLAESRSAGPFTLHPARLIGSAAYKDFLSYLLFIESRPEIGNIEALSLARTPEGRVDFSVLLTWQELKKQNAGNRG